MDQVRCLYPLFAPELDPVSVPEAFEVESAEPDVRDRAPFLADVFDDDRYDPDWFSVDPSDFAFGNTATLEDPDDDDAFEEKLDSQDDF